jgi:hypothetical protein
MKISNLSQETMAVFCLGVATIMLGAMLVLTGLTVRRQAGEIAALRSALDTRDKLSPQQRQVPPASPRQ